MSSIGGIGAAQAFSRVQEMQQMQGNAQVQQQQMQQVQQNTDQQRIEAAQASGSKVGGSVNTYAWGIPHQKIVSWEAIFLFYLTGIF